MVSVVHVSDASAPAPAAVTAIDDGAWVGVVADGAAVLFPRAPVAEGPTQAAAVEARIPGTGPTAVYWTGLAAGAGYSVSVADRVVTLTPGGSETADAGGVLVFELN